MGKRDIEDHERDAMVDRIQYDREVNGQEPTKFIPPDRGQKQLSCYAVGALRRKAGISSEQAASVMAVLIWLIKHANPTTGRCDPSIAKLAFETGFAESTIKRALEVAEATGYVEIEPRLGATSAYHLNFEAMEADFREIEEGGGGAALSWSHAGGHANGGTSVGGQFAKSTSCRPNSIGGG